MGGGVNLEVNIIQKQKSVEKNLKLVPVLVLTAFLDQPVAVIEGNNLITKEVVCVLMFSQAKNRVVELDIFELIS